jgi:hypothetical protein
MAGSHRRDGLPENSVDYPLAAPVVVLIRAVGGNVEFFVGLVGVSSNPHKGGDRRFLNLTPGQNG